jgi:hypothetical protein
MLISSISIILYLNYLTASNKKETSSSLITEGFTEAPQDVKMENAEDLVLVEAC